MLAELPPYARELLIKMIVGGIIWFGGLLLVFCHPWFKLEKTTRHNPKQ
jgi:hypothetical protein